MSEVIIVLPAYNEELNIFKTVGEFHTHLFSQGYQARFIIVDDGSQDNTVGVLRGLQATIPVEVLTHGKNRGIGAALATGLHQAILISAPKDVIITAESDHTQSGRVILSLVHEIQNGAELVVASPLWEGGFVGVPLHREWLSRGGNLVYRTLFPIPGLNDYTNLYRGFSASLLKQGLATYGAEDLFDCKGFESVPDLIIKLRPFYPRVKEVPVKIDFTKRKGGTSMSLIKTIASSLALCFKHLTAS